MMKHVIELENILSEEFAIYEKIYELEAEKGDSILARNGEHLAKISAEQDKLIARINGLEAERVKAIKSYCAVKGLPDSSMGSLSDIVKTMDSDSDLRLTRIGIELKKVLTAIKDIQKVNDKMIGDNLEFYNLLLSDLREGAGPTGAYGRDGREEIRKGGSLLLSIKA